MQRKVLMRLRGPPKINFYIHIEGDENYEDSKLYWKMVEICQ